MVKPKYIYQILLSIAALTFCSCKKTEVTEAPQQKESPTQESITTDEVKYDDLGYDKGLFTLEDKPFTGTSIRNHSNGKIAARYQFVDGIYDGIIEEWYENGQKSAYKMYKEGRRHGITTYWNEKGEPTKQVLYENDEEVEVKTGDQIPEDLGI